MTEQRTRPSPGASRLWPLLLLVAACDDVAGDHHQGYVEGDYVYVASSVAGTLEELHVAQGEVVEAGARLFRLEQNPESLRIEQTRVRIAQASARKSDLEKGVRPPELAALEAQLGKARSALERARRDHGRRRELFDAGETDAVSAEELDRFESDLRARSFDVAGIEAELQTARLGGREDAIAAAASEVDALTVSLRLLDWQLDEKAVSAPAGALVQDTLYRVGEFVPAGRPVVSLLPPENIKVRFFVPQALLPLIQPGDAVSVSADGLGERIRATISFISPEAEFTPPVIYSKESRTKLVFMVEAVPGPNDARRLRPGQPLEVTLD